MRLRTQASLTAVAQGLASGVFLMQWLVTARVLSKHDFATIQQVMLVVMLVLPALAGVFGGANYFLARYDRARQKAFIWQSMGLSAALGLAFAAVLLLIRPLLGGLFNNQQLPGAIAVFCLFPLAALPSFAMGQLLICNQRVGLAAALQVVLAALETVLVLAPVLAGWPLQWFFLGRLAAAAVSLAVMAAYAALLYDDTPADWGLGIVKEQLRYCLPAIGAGQLANLNRHLDKLIVSLCFTPDVMAVYTVGARQFPLIGVVRNGIASVTIPSMARHFAKNQVDTVRWLWQQVMRRHIMFLLPAGIFAVTFAKQIIPLLVGSKYTGSVIFFQIYMATMLWHCLAGEHILGATGRTRTLLLSMLAMLAINIPLSWISARAGWLIGPAIATVLSLGVGTSINATIAARTLGVRFRQLFPLGFAIRIVLTSLVPLLPAILAADRFESALCSLATAGLCYGGCWLVLSEVQGLTGLCQWLANRWSAQRADSYAGGN
jgi:O-antigen/teichoic acid export membrane protein